MNRGRAHFFSRICFWLFFLSPVPAAAQQPAAPPPGTDIVEILADSQQKAGDSYLLRGNVEIRYRGMTLTADEATYNEKTRIAEARGHVVLERDDDRVEAEEARYDLSSGEGTFLKVRGTAGVPPRRTNDYLVTTNPLYFEGERVERREDGSYVVHKGWVTNCQPGRPKWRLRAARARIRPGKDVRLRRSTFSLRRVPILYFPFAAVSIADEPRQSGFLMPSFGNDSLRGTSFGGGYFWAINPHADLTAQAEFFNQGGWTQTAELRALPSTSSAINVRYFGAVADKLARTQRRRRNIGVDQSGQFAHVFAVSQLPRGFRAVADISVLSSFRFRSGFAETFQEAITSEVRADAFVANNPQTLSFNGFFGRFQNFFSGFPESSITLLTVPGLEFGTRPRLLSGVESQPLYFSFDSHVEVLRREEPRFRTPEVQRYGLYPRVSLPLRLGPYFGLTPTFGVRAARYSSRLIDDPAVPGGKQVLNRPLRRITEEVSVDLRFPSFARIFERAHHRYKHVIEPEVTYRYVNGVRAFDELLRFDERDVLTDTHEVEYAITQRLYVRERKGKGQARELVRWRLGQKYYFDPDFRGALTRGERNVFRALISVTPFAFAEAPRRFSPIVSALRVSPGGRYDTDFRLDYDPEESRLLNTRLRVTTSLTRLIRFSVTHFSTRNRELLQPRSNQLGVRVTYGRLFRQGFNVGFVTNWDIRRRFLPNTVAQVSYNWDCCGVALSFRRLGLGLLRSQNEYRFVFTVANIGSFGTIRRQDRLF